MHRMRKRRWGRLAAEDGVAAVEFALVVTLLLVIVIGIIEFGIAFSQLNVYTGAAREGARYAAVRCAPDTTTGCTNALIAARVSSSAVGYTIGPGSPTASTTCTTSNIGQPVTVSWNQNFHIDIPFIPGLANATFTKTITGVFRCE
jgi:Flp pilus assembly protein TadG